MVSDLSGLSVGSKSSLFAEKINEKVFSDNFTLYQDKDPEEKMRAFFDTEGAVNENYKYTLIENGKILTPYTDKKMAKMFNLHHTGCAGGAYDGVPTLGGFSYTIKESEFSLNELLKGEKGIFVLFAAGGDFTPDGKFGTPVQVSFLMENGKLIGKLPELQISSHIYDMFGQDFRGVSNDNINDLTTDKYLVIDMNVKKMQ